MIKKDADNYDVSTLNSEEEEEEDSDDDSEPKKPIPEWAKEINIQPYSQTQITNMLNYTRLFRASANPDINLEEVFGSKKGKNFSNRTSSAHWPNTPVWKTNGIMGDSSFMNFRNYPKN